jgi:hypothetical protein
LSEKLFKNFFRKTISEKNTFTGFIGFCHRIFLKVQVQTVFRSATF